VEPIDCGFTRSDGTQIWALVSISPIIDSDNSYVGGLGMVTDITHRKKAEEQQALLLRELDHRVKNSLATVSALAELSMNEARSLQEYRESFLGRLHAMARTHEALAREQWTTVRVDEIVNVVLAAETKGRDARIRTAGDSVRLPATLTTGLALVLNELGTNALKHGALSQNGGLVNVSWRMTDADTLELDWIETGGPHPSGEILPGTGLELVEGLATHEMNGSLSLEFLPEGLRCNLQFPLSQDPAASRSARSQ
jgi:two-component system CheB/CheR fusion protein